MNNFFSFFFFVIIDIVIWRKASVRGRKTFRKRSKEQIQNDFSLYVHLTQNFYIKRGLEKKTTKCIFQINKMGIQ